MKKLNITYICLTIGILSLILPFFNSIRLFSLLLSILGIILSVIFIIKNKHSKKGLLIVSLILSFLSIPLSFGMDYVSQKIDYTSVETFEKALDDEKNVVGKTIRFKVTAVTENAINASNEIAFYTTKTEAKEIKKGDIITVKVKSEATNVLGVYVMSGNVQAKKSVTTENSSDTKKNAHSDKNKTYDFHNTKFTTPSNWIKQLSDNSSQDDTINFTLKEGYLNIRYLQTNDSILNDDFRNSFISSLKNFNMTNETKGLISESYAWYISFIKNGEKYNGETVILDVDGGIITFTIFSSGDTFSKNYEKDFNDFLSSINYSKRVDK